MVDRINTALLAVIAVACIVIAVALLRDTDEDPAPTYSDFEVGKARTACTFDGIDREHEVVAFKECVEARLAGTPGDDLSDE